MNGRYTWLPGHGVEGTVEPLKPADALPAGPVLTTEEKAAWKALWADRLSRQKAAGPVHVSVLHHSGSPCEGSCPNRVHGEPE